MDLWPYILPVAILCLVAGFMVWRRRSARPSSMSPVIYDLLSRATEQGSYMSVEFVGHELDEEHFLGPCLGFDHQSLTIDIGQNTDHPEWIGAAVHVNFRLDNKKSTVYHQFVSQVRATTRRRNNNLCLELDTPEEILFNQKRRFVRILPLREAIHGLGVWALENDAPRPQRPSALGKAPLHYRLNQEGPLELMDISAAGLRLGLRPGEESLASEIQIGTRLLCLLILHPAKGGDPLSFWLDCTVTNILEEADRLFFGLSFEAWAMALPSKDFVEWSLAGENGWIGPLGTWVWHQQLAQVALSQTVRN